MKKKSSMLRTLLLPIFLISLFLVTKPYFKTFLNNNNKDKLDKKIDVKLVNLGIVLNQHDSNEIISPNINYEGTKISDYEVILNPGESISYSFDISNNSDVQVKLKDMELPTPTCFATDGNSGVDVNNLCAYVSYKLTYTGESGNNFVSLNDTINAKTIKHMKITLKYSVPSDDPNVGALPILIKNLGISLNYDKI